MGWGPDNFRKSRKLTWLFRRYIRYLSRNSFTRATGKWCHSRSNAPYPGQLTQWPITANIAELEKLQDAPLDSVACAKQAPLPLPHAPPPHVGRLCKQ